MVQVPLHRLPESRLEAFLRTPVTLTSYLACVDRIAAVVSGPVLDESDQVGIHAVAARAGFVEQRANSAHYVDIGPLAVTADVIGFAGTTACQNGSYRAAVVEDVQPIADIHAVPVHRQRFSGQRVVNGEWDELLRELVRAVIIRAVRRQRRQTVGAMVG